MRNPTIEQLVKINQLTRTPLSADQVYVFTSKMVGTNMISERFQQITPNFLNKMAGQAKDGVSLLLDHSWANLGILTIPIGRSFDAKIQQEADGELALYGDFYIVRGQTLNGVSTDEIIASIDNGTLFDTSIGFTVTKAICSIDGFDYYNSAKCMHWRGMEYDGEVCTIALDDGSLMENSLVFDGAYAGAGVVAASKTADSHDHKILSPVEDTKELFQSDRVLFTFSNKTGLHMFANSKNPESERNDVDMELQQQLNAANNYLDSVRASLKIDSNEAITSALESLKTNAELGQQYRTKVVDEALSAGIRAMGDNFSAEAMKSALSALPVAEVEKIRDTYEKQAQSALGGGGRHVEGAELGLPNGQKQAKSNGGEESVEDKLAKARDEARAALKQHAPKFLKEA